MKVELYDGTMLDFPDDTPPDVVQRTSKRMTFERKAAERDALKRCSVYARLMMPCLC